MKPIKPVIIAYKKAVIDDEFKQFVKKHNPLGLILTQESCHNPAQLKQFVADFRDCVGREDAPVSIDQEGGRAQRLAGRILFDHDHLVLKTHAGSEHWPYFPPAALLGEIYEKDAVLGTQASYRMGLALGSVLDYVGVDLNYAPVIDVPQIGADKIISDRAFSADPETIITLAEKYTQGMHEWGVKSCIKHVPGHGRSLVDSHKSLAVVDADRQTLATSDFIPVKAMAKAPWAMVAHVLFTALDKQYPATQSPFVIEDILRKELGLTGVICSDCIWMEALQGSLPERAKLCQQAGIDVVIAVHGNLDEQAAILDAVQPASDVVLERLDDANKSMKTSRQKSARSNEDWKKEFALFVDSVEEAGFDFPKLEKVGEV